MLVRAVSPRSWVDSNNALIKALEKNSETLQNITESFVGISRDFKMFFFWEELRTAIPGMGRELVSPASSNVPVDELRTNVLRLLNSLRRSRKRFPMLIAQLSMLPTAICANSVTRIRQAGTFWPDVYTILLSRRQVPLKEIGLRNSGETCRPHTIL